MPIVKIRGRGGGSELISKSGGMQFYRDRVCTVHKASLGTEGHGLRFPACVFFYRTLSPIFFTIKRDICYLY
jgi:hypothetical protein